jgi:hypothetical protein
VESKKRQRTRHVAWLHEIRNAYRIVVVEKISQKAASCKIEMKMGG